MENYGCHIEIPRKNGIIKDTPLTALAFFLGPPQGWKCSNWDDKIVKQFTSSLEKCDNIFSENIVVHGCYLINPASEREDVKIKSEKRFLEEVKLCDILNVGNYVFHPGTSKDTQKGLQKAVDLINLGVLETKHVNILVENMTKTNTLCQTWQEVEWVINHVADNTRVGNCLDTAHCWGAGEQKGMFMDTLLDDYDRIVGIKHLKAIHLNDSKVEYGSNKDRHEDILKGQIPKRFWNSFIFDKRVKTIPAILETPSNCHPVIREIIRNKCVKIEEIKIENQKKDIKEYLSKEVSDKKDEDCPRCSSIVNEISDLSDSSNESSDSSDESSDSSDESSDSSDESSDSSDESSDSSGEGTLKSEYKTLENILPKEWQIVLQDEFKKSYFYKLKSSLESEEKKGVKIYPPVDKIFNAFHFCNPKDIKVVIIGQDPYHADLQAEGLSFSVPIGVKIPSSLRNIYKELSNDIDNFSIPKDGHLGKWSEQGVFLLNASLTVEKGKAGGHLNLGWQQFTDYVLKYINNNYKDVVFILWGNFAKKKCDFIDKKKHNVLRSVHPSGLSANRGFFGCRHFSRCNKYLKSKGLTEINWQV